MIQLLNISLIPSLPIIAVIMAFIIMQLYNSKRIKVLQKCIMDLNKNHQGLCDNQGEIIKKLKTLLPKEKNLLIDNEENEQEN